MSSTLRELQDERNAAREAIRHIRLAPVLFELGARPYPPRTLYRAYLEQSHVFIGIYWQQYGWIAPDMDVSGLEDEYRLSADKPRLIYIREPAPDRDPRLTQLLDQIRQEGGASYKSFRSPAELQALIEEDLALLLSERFEDAAQQRMPVTETSQPRAPSIPVPSSTFIGRAQEVQTLREMLEQEDTRLVSLTGVGGIGKTRLALAVATQLRERFADGARVIFLDSVTAHNLVIPAIMQALGLEDSSGRPPMDILKQYLQEREMLLVLDNFEHVIEAGLQVGELLESCPRLKILVTTREALQITGEHRFEVPPLAVPTSAHEATLIAGQAEAVRLFVDRAQAVQPRFQLDDATAPIVSEIVRRLEGLPLAIELAAARVRLMPPGAILQRLTSRLETLTGGPRDLPQRQRTIRKTLDWSYGLLEEREKALLACLSVFVGGWTLDAAGAVCTPKTDDTLEAISSLIDKSLVRVEEFDGDEPRFSLLEIVHEYASERLVERGEAERRRDLHAEYFLSLAEKSDRDAATAPREQWLERFTADAGNFRAATRWLLDRGAAGRAVQLGWALWNWRWMRGRLSEAASSMEETLASPEALASDDRAKAELVVGTTAFWLGDHERGLRHLRQAHALWRDMGDRLWTAIAQAALGGAIGMTEDAESGESMMREALGILRSLKYPWGTSYIAWMFTALLLRQGRGVEVVPLLEEVAAWARGAGEKAALAMTLTYLGMVRLATHDPAGARSALLDAFELSRDLDRAEGPGAAPRPDPSHAASLVGSLEALAALSVTTADYEKGALLFGAAEGVRRSIGTTIWAPERETRERTERTLREALGHEGFRTKFSEGMRMSPEDTARVAVSLR